MVHIHAHTLPLCYTKAVEAQEVSTHTNEMKEKENGKKTLSILSWGVSLSVSLSFDLLSDEASKLGDD
jgi:hypothetical protein